MNLLPYGEHALLAELDEPHDVPAVREALAGEPGVVDAVAGARTVLAVFDPSRTSAQRVAAAFARPVTRTQLQSVRTVELTVRYDGPDLDEVAEETGLDREDVIARHCAPTYTVRFCGFAPGFAYLDGLDERLHVPRRAEPRTAVPAGSVGIAGEFTGVYPRPSPGGWRLLGRTDAPLWELRREPPALLMPGTRVRFVPS